MNIIKDRNLMPNNAIDISDFDILKKYTNLYDDSVAVLPDIESLPNLPVKINWVIIAVVKSGCAVLMINDVEYRIAVNNMLILLPGHIIHIESSSSDFKLFSLCLSLNILERSAIFTTQSWSIMNFIFVNPVVRIENDSIKLFKSYYEIISLKLELGKGLYYKESIFTVVQSFIYDLYALLEPMIRKGDLGYTSGKLLFMKFLDITSKVYPKPRNVDFYSDKLNVTSKYLSSVCKTYSGKTATAIINQLVVKDIVFLLTHSSKSIKEIMIELDFPSLSFFGKYVKNHLGMGPKEFRNRKNNGM